MINLQVLSFQVTPLYILPLIQLPNKISLFFKNKHLLNYDLTIFPEYVNEGLDFGLNSLFKNIPSFKYTYFSVKLFFLIFP